MSDFSKHDEIVEVDEASIDSVSGGAFLRGDLYTAMRTEGYSVHTKNGTVESQSGTTLCDIVSKTYFCSDFTS